MRSDGKHAALVRAMGKRGEWFRLHQLVDAVGGGETAVSARIRELRRPEHGAHAVEVRRMASGVFYYRINPQRALPLCEAGGGADDGLHAPGLVSP